MDNSRGPKHTAIWGFTKIRGTFLGGHNNKGYSILGSILGSPYFGKLPYDNPSFYLENGIGYSN